MNIGAIGMFILKNETLVQFFQSFNPFFLVLCHFSKSKQMKNISLLLFLVSIISFEANAQQVWTLEKCLSYARNNSIAIKQAELGIEGALLTEKNMRMMRYPNVRGTASGGAQFGRTIDPTTNSFENQTIGFNNLSISTGVTIYNGNRINNTIKQSKVDAEAARLDALNASNNLMLNIASSYLNILMAEEQLANAKSRRKLSDDQLKRVDRLINAGSLPKNDRLNVLSQIALDDQTVIQAQNAVDIGYLQLKNLMAVEPSTNFKIGKPDVDVPDTNPDLFKFETVYAAALNSQPNVKAAEKSEESAEIQVDIAKAALLPLVSAFGGIDSRWSSAGRQRDGSIRIPETFDVEFNNIQSELTIFNDFPLFSKVNYFDQINENLGQNLGVSVQVPIYNNHTNRTNIERAKLGVLSAQYQAEQIKQQLKADIQTSIANARAGRKTYEAAQFAYDAAKAAFENAEKRYQLGTINSFDYANARTNLDAAQIEVIRSKYDYIFRLKIVDFYTGKKLSF